MKKLFALLLCFSLFSLISCSDDNGPTVEITAPSNGSIYAPGDLITIQGTATDDVEITNLSIEGMDGFNLSETLDISNVQDKANIPFNLDVTLSMDSVPGDYSLSITATDNDGNTESDELEFTIQ